MPTVLRYWPSEDSSSYQRHGMVVAISRFLLLFYSEFLSKSFHYAQFYSFCAAASITIPYLQFKLPIKVSYFSYLMLVEQLNVLISLSLMSSLSVLIPKWETSLLFSSQSSSLLFYIICKIFLIIYTHYSWIISNTPNNSGIPYSIKIPKIIPASFPQAK